MDDQRPHPEALAAKEWLTHEQLVEEVRPSIEFVRREVSGAPFPTIEKAVAWIEGAPPPKSRFGAKRTRELARRVSEATDGLGVVKIRNPFVRYWKRRSNTVYRVRVAPGSAQATLGAHAEAIAKGTGWHVAEVVMWVLTGREPAPVCRVHYRVNMRFTSLPAGGNLYRKTVVLEVYDPDVKDHEWRRVLKGIRKEFRRDGKAPLPKKDHILYKVVQEKGSKAAEGKTWTAHWKAIAQECNHLLGRTWFADHHGPYLRWHRLRKKLEGIQEHRGR